METTLDPEKQKQAKEYSRIRRRLWLVDTIFSAVYFPFSCTTRHTLSV